MKITIVSKIDYAASGLKLANALKQYTKHDIKFFAGRYYNKYNHPQSKLHTWKEIQREVDNSDIVHLKGDFPPSEYPLKFNKPIIISVSGSHFRSKKYWGYGKYDLRQYDTCTIRTAMTPDLMYEGFRFWTPHPVDSIGKENIWKRSAHPVLVHTPTSRVNKDTQFIESVFYKLHKRIKIETIIAENKTFDEILELKKEATIFFDQFKVGFYGNSAIEAMQYGIPAAAWIAPMCYDNTNLSGCPIITARKNVDLWVDLIETILDGDMITLSEKTKQWCDNVHSYQAIAKLWDGIYDLI